MEDRYESLTENVVFHDALFDNFLVFKNVSFGICLGWFDPESWCLSAACTSFCSMVDIIVGQGTLFYFAFGCYHMLKGFAISNFHPAYIFILLNHRLWPVEWGNSPSLIFCASLQNVSVFSLASWFLLMPTRGSHSVSLLPLRSMIWFNFFDPNRNACRSLFSGIFHVFLMRMECAGWIFDSIKGPTIFLVIDWRLLLRMA